MHNFQQRILTLKTTLNIWKQRKLSLKGKITVLNHLALAPLIYVTSVVDTSKRAIQEINNATQNFISDGNTSKIVQQTLIQSIQNGGLTLCYIETNVKALKLFWVKLLTCEAPSNWKILPKAFYNCQNLSTYFNAKYKVLTPKHMSIPNLIKKWTRVYL